MGIDAEEEEIARNLWRQAALLPPNSAALRRWEAILRYLFIVNLFVLPVDIFFYHRTEFHTATDPLDYAIDIFFFLDVLRNFRTTYRVQETDTLVTNWKELGRHYFERWAIPDLVATIPWDLTGVRQLKLLKLLRITHMLKMRRERYGDGAIGKNVNVKRVIYILANFLLTAHWVGCMWWCIGSLETDAAIANGEDPLVYKGSWQRRIPTMKWNSASAYSLDKDSPFAQQYFSSLYWSFTALVKVPWIAPNTIIEKLYASAIIVLGAIFFAFLLGAIVAAINAVERSNSQRRDKMTLMHHFCSSRRLGGEIKGNMTRYVDAMFTFNNLIEGTERLGTLPQSLRGSLLEVIYRQMLDQCQLMKIVARSTALQLCQRLQPQVCLAKSVLVEKNSIMTHLFLLHRGALHVTLGDEQDNAATKRKGSEKGPHLKGKSSLRVRVIERMGNFVGLYDPYDFAARLPLQVTAVKLSQLFAILRHDLIDVVHNVGEDEGAILLGALEHEKQVVLDALKVNRQSKLPEAGSRRRSSAGDELRNSSVGSGEVQKKRRESVTAGRRRSVAASATVGSLLNGGAAVAAPGAMGEAAASATLMMWDDAVSEVKLAARSLEDQTKSFRNEVGGFVTGMSSMKDLVKALNQLPDDLRPRAAGGPVSTKPVTTLPRMEEALAARGNTTLGGRSEPSASHPDSSTRLFDNIAKMGQDIISGFSSNRTNNDSANPTSRSDTRSPHTTSPTMARSDSAPIEVPGSEPAAERVDSDQDERQRSPAAANVEELLA